MKNHKVWKGLFTFAALLQLTIVVTAQKPKPLARVSKPAIFAVLNDGKTLEPIAYVNKGKLEAPVNGSDEVNIITAFNKTYYKPGTVYRLIFGAAGAGTVKVNSSDAKAECARNMAQVTTTSTRVQLKGLVMAIATNVPSKSTNATFRRKPTSAEKEEIDALAKAEFIKQKLTPKMLRYQNLTALDVDNDGKGHGRCFLLQ